MNFEDWEDIISNLKTTIKDKSLLQNKEMII